MHIAGIIDGNNSSEVVDTLKFILKAEKRKFSITDYSPKSKEVWKDYLKALEESGIELLIVRLKTNDFHNLMDIIILDSLLVNENEHWEIISLTHTSKWKDTLKRITIILNGDTIIADESVDEQKLNVLSYGFRSNSHITTSSTGEPSMSGQFLCCIKEGLITSNGKRIEPQEFVLKMEGISKSPYNILAAASLAVINDIEIGHIN